MTLLLNLAEILPTQVTKKKHRSLTKLPIWIIIDDLVILRKTIASHKYIKCAHVIVFVLRTEHLQIKVGVQNGLEISCAISKTQKQLIGGISSNMPTTCTCTCMLILHLGFFKNKGDWNTLQGINISHSKGTFEDDFPFPQVGYVNSLEGRLFMNELMTWDSPTVSGLSYWSRRMSSEAPARCWPWKNKPRVVGSKGATGPLQLLFPKRFWSDKVFSCTEKIKHVKQVF